MIIGTLIFVVAFISFLIVYNSSNKSHDDGFRVLFDNLTNQDAALIVQELEKRKVEYKLPQTGIIEVPKDIVEKTRLDIAALGIPQDSRVGFELFDKQEFGATDFEQTIKYLRALEGTLSETIESIHAVNKAKVSIAMPKESLFVSKETPVTASVVIELKQNMVLAPKQVNGIKNLVAASVAKLDPKNVQIVNQFGDPLGGDDELTKNNELLKAKLEYKKRFERNLEAKIIDILAPIVGSRKKVVARVTVDVEFSQIASKSEVFSPDNVVRSEQTMEEKKEGASGKEVGGVPGAVSNVGPAQNLTSDTAKEKYSKATTTTNYEISKTIKDIKEDFVKINRITSAVVIDGKYEYKKDKDGNPTDELEYMSRTTQDLSAIENLVKRAIGYNNGRGDEVSVSNFQFNVTKKVSEALSPSNEVIAMIDQYIGPFEPLLKYLFLAIVLFLFYKKVIQPFSHKMLEMKPEEEEDILKREINFDEEEVEDTFDKLKAMRTKVEQQLGINGDMNEDELKYDVLLERIRDMVEEKSDEMGSVLQALLKEEIGALETHAKGGG